MKLAGQFLRFSLVGSAGYLVDVSVLYFVHRLGLDLYSARLVSFVTAATATWLGNRFFTFSSDRRSRAGIAGEWASYLAAMVLGGLVNYGIYALLITYSPLFYAQPWLAVAAGTGAGLLINFTTARRILHPPGA
jgi:putative flippase GtrA